MRIGTQLNQNQQMQAFLRKNGFINAVPKYLEKGSLRGCWRIYSRPRGGGFDAYDKWTDEVREKLTSLGFVDFDGKELSKYSGNGGVFSIFARVRGAKEGLK